MPNRTALGLFLCQISSVDWHPTLMHHFAMAAHRDVITAGLCRPVYARPLNRRFHTETRTSADLHKVLKLGYDNGFSKGRYHDGTFKSMDQGLPKAQFAAPCGQLVRELDVGFKANVATRLVNGNVAGERGNPIEFRKFSLPQKLVVAVDVDEVLGSFLSALNRFIADRYSLNHSVAEYHVYEFCKIWNCSRTEADIRVHEFFKTPYFKLGIHPIPGAQHALLRLSTFCNLFVVTSRQNAIKDHTIEWIEKHFPGLFQEIHFGNHFALDGHSRSKSEICRSFGAQVLIDDNPQYAIDSADAGIKVLLFDYNNSYPWCKSGLADQHPLVTKVHNWQEVEQHLGAYATSS